MFEAFSEHNRIWAFSEPGDDSPFLLDEVKRRFVDLPLCPTAVVGRGKDLEGWSGSHVKAGPSPDELCAVRGSFLPHCIFRARWQLQINSTSLEKQFAGCPWATIRAVSFLPGQQGWNSGEQQLYLAAELSSGDCRELIPTVRAHGVPDYSLCAAEQVGCCQAEGQALPPQRLESRKWHFLFFSCSSSAGFSTISWEYRDPLHPWCSIQYRTQPRLGAVPRKQQQCPGRQQHRWETSLLPLLYSHLLYTSNPAQHASEYIFINCKRWKCYDWSLVGLHKRKPARV